jgi:hypothetical protein
MEILEAKSLRHRPATLNVRYVTLEKGDRGAMNDRPVGDRRHILLADASVRGQAQARAVLNAIPRLAFESSVAVNWRDRLSLRRLLTGVASPV